MQLQPSASYQRGGYNSNKYQPRTLSGPVTYGRTSRSEHYQDPVTMEGTVLIYCCVFWGIRRASLITI